MYILLHRQNLAFPFAVVYLIRGGELGPGGPARAARIPPLVDQTERGLQRLDRFRGVALGLHHLAQYIRTVGGIIDHNKHCIQAYLCIDEMVDGMLPDFEVVAEPHLEALLGVEEVPLVELDLGHQQVRVRTGRVDVVQHMLQRAHLDKQDIQIFYRGSSL